ncbi:MAG: hypothetical protein MK080_11000 [Opitutales bacterium]|nr:hypothetical protein [Opitutales bacterium]NRA27993.1 hypothetical protein [Opitutales bacterium]
MNDAAYLSVLVFKGHRRALGFIHRAWAIARDNEALRSTEVFIYAHSGQIKLARALLENLGTGTAQLSRMIVSHASGETNFEAWDNWINETSLLPEEQAIVERLADPIELTKDQ